LGEEKAETCEAASGHSPLLSFCCGKAAGRRVRACTHAILLENAKRACKHTPYVTFLQQKLLNSHPRLDCVANDHAGMTGNFVSEDAGVVDDRLQFITDLLKISRRAVEPIVQLPVVHQCA
jgi:hypothetical protein